MHSDRESARRRRGRRPLRQADQSRGRQWASTGGDDTRRSGRSSVRRDRDCTFYGRRLNAQLRDDRRVCERRRLYNLARRGGGPEYRIHAAVGLHNASATFHTGDLVELDADHSVLQQISED